MHAHEEREWQTRKKRIGGRLQTQGWEVYASWPGGPGATDASWLSLF